MLGIYKTYPKYKELTIFLRNKAFEMFIILTPKKVFAEFFDEPTQHHLEPLILMGSKIEQEPSERVTRRSCPNVYSIDTKK